MYVAAANRKLQKALRVLAKADTERKVRNARQRVLEALRALRASLDAHHPVVKRAKYEAPRPCKHCGQKSDEHPQPDCQTYEPRPKKRLSVRRKSGLRRSRWQRNGLAVLNNADERVEQCAQAGVRVVHEPGAGRWWGPAWLNELPKDIDLEHYTLNKLRRAKRDLPFRRALLAELAMKRRQGVVQ